MKLKFVEKKSEIKGVYSFIFQPEKPLKWQAGQYLHYELPHPETDDRGVGRWFTISAAPFEKHIQLTTRFDGEKVSSFKQALLKLEPSTEVEAGEPRGDFIYDPYPPRLVFIAGGIGITPYRSMLAELDHEGKKLNIDLLWANRDENLPLGEEVAALAEKHPEFKLKKFIGEQRISPADVQEHLADETIPFYLSGPKPMVETYQKMLEEIGIQPERIKLDYFPGY